MKKVLSISVLVFVGFIATNVAKAQTVIDEGRCGDNLTWQLTSNGILTINGTGAMDDYNPHVASYPQGPKIAPWDSYKEKIETVIIGNGATTIGTYAFEECSKIISVDIPNSVTTIGYFAFNECSRLTSVIIPDAVTAIGYAAFSNCSKLTSINIPNSVRVIDEQTFSGCSSLTSVIIPNSVTEIKGGAFNGCSKLTSIEIPNSVTVIGVASFSDCGKLTSIEIPNSVIELGSYAFADCMSLTSAIIGDAVNGIGNDTFANCFYLTSVTIGKSVAWIENDAFAYCNWLKTIICKATTPPKFIVSSFSSPFVGVSGDANIIIPCHTWSDYMSSVWGNIFKNFEEDCNSLNDVTQNEIIILYPNPINDIFFIESENFVSINLYNVLGKEVVNQNATGKTEIDIAYLPAGIYFVRITTNKGAVTRKVVKQ